MSTPDNITAQSPRAPLDDREMPVTALLLGAAGALPFIILAGVIVLELAPFGLPERALHQALLTYAALIASFLGGIRWGIALSKTDERQAGWLFVGSVIPALLAWLALAAPRPHDLTLITMLFLALAIADVRLVLKGGAPRWFGTLRLALSIAVLGSLLLVMLTRS